MSRVLISTKKALLHLSDPSWIFMDCRFNLSDPGLGERSYGEAHLPGASYAHLDRDLSGKIVKGKTGRHPLPDATVFCRKLEAWGIAKEMTLVCYDDTGGMFAARFWWMMKWLGHENCCIINGGWKEWIRDGYPVSSSIPSRKRTSYKPMVHHHLLAMAVDVEKKLGQKGQLLVDARAENRYRGLEEPLDPVAGHIPGAICVPYAANIDESHKWKSKKELRETFKFLETFPEKERVFYCGSGVSACHNIVSAVHAGYSMPVLYAGSWSEWITDPKRPVER